MIPSQLAGAWDSSRALSPPPFPQINSVVFKWSCPGNCARRDSEQKKCCLCRTQNLFLHTSSYKSLPSPILPLNPFTDDRNNKAVLPFPSLKKQRREKLKLYCSLPFLKTISKVRKLSGERLRGANCIEAPCSAEQETRFLSTQQTKYLESTLERKNYQ